MTGASPQSPEVGGGQGGAGLPVGWLAQALYAALRERPEPVLVSGDRVVPAASLWTGARRWVAAWREAGVEAGDRVVLALPADVPFVQVLVAALCSGVTLVVAPPGERAVRLLNAFDARLAVAEPELQFDALPGERRVPAGGVPACWSPAGVTGPASGPPPLRSRSGETTPEVALVLRTSGTSGAPRWHAVSEGNLGAVLRSHLPHLALGGARVLSVLPWHHAFGLVLDLLPALLSAAEVVRDPSGGADPYSICELLEQWHPTHLSCVPEVLRRTLAHPRGVELLRSLRGGIVGGAPVGPALADVLAATSLRAGYGLTAASPGVTLGRPGQWRPGHLGKPVGCEVRIDSDEVLHVRGPNVCAGAWQEGRFVPAVPGRWLRTGDRVCADQLGLRFIGRADDDLKLDNGRWVPTSRLEQAVRDLCPGAEDVLVVSHDGQRLDVVVGMRAGTAELPSRAVLAMAWGTFGARLGRVCQLPEADWVRAPKGGIRRPETAACALALRSEDENAQSTGELGEEEEDFWL